MHLRYIFFSVFILKYADSKYCAAGGRLGANKTKSESCEEGRIGEKRKQLFPFSSFHSSVGEMERAALTQHFSDWVIFAGKFCLEFSRTLSTFPRTLNSKQSLGFLEMCLDLNERLWIMGVIKGWVETGFDQLFDHLLFQCFISCVFQYRLALQLILHWSRLRLWLQF